MNSGIKKFENQRWSLTDSKKGFKYEAVKKIIDTGSVLDLGCGDGFFLKSLAPQFNRLKGLDISEEAVKKARDKDIDAEVFDFANDPLPCENSSFDTVVMLDILEHLYSPQNLLKEAKRVAKKSIIISVPNFNSLPARIQTFLGRVPENNTPSKGHIYWFNMAILRKLMKNSGLKIVAMETNTFWQDRFLVGHLASYLSRTWSSVFALSFVIKAQKII